MVCIGLTVGVALLGVVNVASDGEAVQVYGADPPVTDNVVGLPLQIVVGVLTTKLEAGFTTTPGKDIVDGGTLLSVTEMVYVPGTNPVNNPEVVLANVIGPVILYDAYGITPPIPEIRIEASLTAGQEGEVTE